MKKFVLSYFLMSAVLFSLNTIVKADNDYNNNKKYEKSNKTEFERKNGSRKLENKENWKNKKNWDKKNYNPEEMHKKHIERLDKELDLSDKQKEKIEIIMNESRKDMEKQRNLNNEKIRKILNEEQRKKFDKMQEEHKQKKQRHFKNYENNRSESFNHEED